MKTDDAKFQEAILNGDYATLEAMAEAGYTEDDEEGVEGEAKKGEIGEDGSLNAEDITSEGDSDSNDADVKNEKSKSVTEEGAPAHADIAEGIEGKISFDENGNAVVPKELLAIIAKNGRHEIPYGVLESARKKATDFSLALEQERGLRKEAEGRLSKNDRQAAILKKQLEDAGIDPEQLPEDFEITPELIESLNEYGDVGKVVKAIIAKQNLVKDKAQDPEGNTPDESERPETNQRRDDYAAYVAKNPEIQKIMDMEGSDEQATLEHFYAQVTKSTAFKDKPLSEQLDQVMMLTNRAIGSEPNKATSEADSNKAIAQGKARQAKENATPASPSEIGLADSGKGSALARARAAHGSELLKIMSELTQAELDTLLDEAE